MRTFYTALTCLGSVLTVCFIALLLLAEKPSASHYFATGLASLSVFIFYHAGRMRREDAKKKEAAETETK